jgi:hypothetical protein
MLFVWSSDIKKLLWGVLKMSEVVDWTKAPNDAVIYIEWVNLSNGFYKDNGSEYLRVDGSGYVPKETIKNGLVNGRNKVHYKPTFIPGKIPPTGSIFEFSQNNACWEERIMLFNDGITCLMGQSECPSIRWHYKCNDPHLFFRPIRSERSEEDKMVEEIKKEVINKFKEKNPERHPPTTSIELTVRTMYQLGYRKHEDNSNG